MTETRSYFPGQVELRRIAGGGYELNLSSLPDAEGCEKERPVVIVERAEQMDPIYGDPVWVRASPRIESDRMLFSLCDVSQKAVTGPIGKEGVA